MMVLLNSQLLQAGRCIKACLGPGKSSQQMSLRFGATVWASQPRWQVRLDLGRSTS